MRRGLLATLLVAAGLAAGVGGVAAFGAFAEDEPVEVITVESAEPASGRASAPSELAVEDGIPRADAERLAAAAMQRAPGGALSVERDDGLYEVEVRERGGDHVEVLLDDAFEVVGVDGDD